jgi:hypothetical protein
MAYRKRKSDARDAGDAQSDSDSDMVAAPGQIRFCVESNSDGASGKREEDYTPLDWDGLPPDILGARKVKLFLKIGGENEPAVVLCIRLLLRAPAAADTRWSTAEWKFHTRVPNCCMVLARDHAGAQVQRYGYFGPGSISDMHRKKKIPWGRAQNIHQQEPELLHTSTMSSNTYLFAPWTVIVVNNQYKVPTLSFGTCAQTLTGDHALRVFLYWNQTQVTMFDINQFQSTALFGSVKVLSADVPVEDTNVALAFVLKVLQINGRRAPRWVEFPQAQWEEVDTMGLHAEFWTSNTSRHDGSSPASVHYSGDESDSLESNAEEEDAVSAWTAAGPAGGAAGGARV